MRRIIALLSKKPQRASESVSEQDHDFQGGNASRRENPHNSLDRLTVDNPRGDADGILEDSIMNRSYTKEQRRSLCPTFSAYRNAVSSRAARPW